MRIVFFHKENCEDFDEFVKNHPFGNVHQTFEWGEFQSKLKGRGKFWAMGVIDKSGDLRATALIVKQDLPFGLSWLYCARGPLVSFGSKVADFLFKEIDNLAKTERAVFLRIDPMIEKNEGSGDEVDQDLFPRFRLAHAAYQPAVTLKIDLDFSEKEILAQMKQKGRYNIRLAMKKGVKVIRVPGDKEMSLEAGIDHFDRLLNETAERDAFFKHQKDFYFNMVKILGAELMASLYLARYHGEIIAGNIVTFFKDEAIYYFGASGNAHRQMMAPYLLQWEAIKDAKKQGFLWFDLLGIAPEEASKDHPLRGVTEFKKKFGGEIVKYIPAMEYVYRPFWYGVIRVIKRA